MPAGMYWIDVFGDNRADFQAWRSVNAETVKVRATQSFSEAPGRDWIKFEVLKPTAWDAKRFGFPTIIPAGAVVNAAEDTVQRPDLPKDGTDQIDDALHSLGGASARALELGALVAGAIVLHALWSRSRGR